MVRRSREQTDTHRLFKTCFTCLYIDHLHIYIKYKPVQVVDYRQLVENERHVS